MITVLKKAAATPWRNLAPINRGTFGGKRYSIDAHTYNHRPTAINVLRPIRSEQKPTNGLKTIFATVKTEKITAKWNPEAPMSLTYMGKNGSTMANPRAMKKLTTKREKKE
jgi:hypothetical protein